MQLAVYPQTATPPKQTSVFFPKKGLNTCQEKQALLIFSPILVKKVSCETAQQILNNKMEFLKRKQRQFYIAY